MMPSHGAYALDVSDSSGSEIDEEIMVEGKDEEVVLPSGENNSLGKKMEAQDPYDFSEEEGNGLHAFSEHDTPMERSMKQKKQRHWDKFATWFEKKKIELKDEIKTSNRDEVDEDLMSAKVMISSKSVIINDPREYQQELFEIAKEQNTIAVLDTGSGKTLIACLLLRHTVDQELQSRKEGKQRRVSFFLVDSVTLVFQQAAVLECNLDAEIGKYCGAMGTDMWSKEQWAAILEKEQVIVMTADVLHNCLTHGLIKMKDINLICFDEAHHAKKNHVYARIVRDFYADEPPESQPRIFGMTASPVDSRDDPKEAALELERLLHSRIATASDLKLLQSSITRPDEQILLYPQLEPPFPTPLYNKLYDKYHKIKCFKRIFDFCLDCSSQLGTWCADEIWKIALSEVEAQKIETKNERLLHRINDPAAVEKVEMEIRMIREAREIVATHHYTNPELALPDVSAKVQKLQQFLDSVYSEDTEDKCIIFVTQRYTAHCLAALLKHKNPAFMRLGILIGTRSGSPGEENVTFRQQMVTVSRFRKGRLNCLIATSVAEEGLDIPDCSRIVRFDLYYTMIQYIQSRGRARHSTSKYVQMVEMGNNEHARRIMEVRDSEKVMREFCQKLPDDRLIKVPEMILEGSLPGTFYIEPSTGAKLTPSAALQLLWRFANNLPKESDYSVPPTYYIRPTDDGTFTCEIILPPDSPVLSVEGKPCRTKAEAKQSAAFMACLKLRDEGFLDEYLLPLNHLRAIPKGANAHLSIDNAKANTYPYRQKPSFWDVAGKPVPGILYVTVFGLVIPETMGRPYQPLCVITREPIPAIPLFTVYADRGGSSEVYAITLKSTLELTPNMLKRLNEFTDRFFHDVFAKTFEITPDIPYWVFPIKHVPITENSELDDIFDNELINLVMEHKELLWDENTPHEFFKDRFLLHKISRSRRFFTEHAVAELTPQCEIPIGACTAPKSATIYDYSYFERQRGSDYPRPEFTREQPVLLAYRVLHRINYLDPPPEREKNTPLRAFIVPSAFEVSCLPPSFASFSICWPAISTRLDAYLHARDVCSLMNIDISLDIALEAITKDSDHSENDNAIVVGQKKGMGSNYERLEFLGDTFLKLTTTLSLYVGYDDDDEYQLHVKRMLMVCNHNLFMNAKMLKLPEYIQTQGFSRREWYPRLKLLKGRKSKKRKVLERLEQEKLAEEKRAAEEKAAVAEQDSAEGGLTENTHTALAETTTSGPKEESTASTKSAEVTANDFKKPPTPNNNAVDTQVITATHKLAPKTIADVCEALIGAAVYHKGFDEGIKVINLVVNNADHDKTKFTQWSSYREQYKIPSYQTAVSLGRHLELVRQIEQKIGYKFKYPRLLTSAFVHPSIPLSWENIPSYQRLEFLGDALHDQACIRYIFDKYPDRGPQWLTEHKMAMVSNKFLASLAVKLDFHRHLRKNGTGMVNAIQSFVDDVTAAELAAKGSVDFWVNVSGPIPKALSDCLEAFIGAMFVDADFDFSVVEMFFDKFIKPYFIDMTTYDTYAGNHPTTLLTTKLKEVGCEDWRILSDEVTEKDATVIYSAVMIHNHIFAHGKAHNVKTARVKASQNALERLADIGLTRFLKICDCATARDRLRSLKTRQKEAEKAARLAGLPLPGEGGRNPDGEETGLVEEKLGIEIKRLQEELEGKLSLEVAMG
ncbi:hypothetical protein L211DRAFT_11749 [Terfezia boudieri ATCC MYA-4762]|uniref:Dicer-like protein 1 n=1 Tax=Terfezia boudieri ATCC MYA-4762 TaxID=1051890 RepID=A0A3N4M2K3_9PEZI|nr:hypothetical protein L211DRAFT_11749 [Terfezia boudieri ATCC MYA-4762]